MSVIIDSYSESNKNTWINDYTYPKCGQSFTGNGLNIDSVKVYLAKSGNPTGNIYIKLYSHSGTFGTSSVPDTLLATSNSVDISTLTSSFTLTSFVFDENNKYLLNNGTNYVIAVEHDGSSVDNRLNIGVDNTSPTHSGNAMLYSGGSWSAFNASDVCFYVYGVNLKSFTVDAHIVKTKTFSIDAFLIKVKNFVVDAHLVKTQTKTFTISASCTAIPPTRYLYKVYNGGQFLGLLPNVISEPSLPEEKNSIGTSMTIKVGMSIDYSNTTESIIASLGTGSSLIKNGNRLQVYEYNQYYPNGRCMFKGQIMRWEAPVGGSNEYITVMAYSDGYDTNNFLISGSPYINDVSQTTQNAHVALHNTSAGPYAYVGQTFKTGGSITDVGAVSLMIKGTADVTVKLFASVPSAPGSITPTALGVATIHVDNASATETLFGFSSPITVTSSTTYFIHVGVGVDQTVDIYYKDSNVYADGIMHYAFYGGGGGGGWAPTPSGSILNASDLYFKTWHFAGATTAIFSTQDPTADMATNFIDTYVSQGGLINYTSGTIDATGLSVPYTFNTATIAEGLNKVLDLSPANFYYYIDSGTNILYIKETSATADFIFTKGVHINELNLVATIEHISNTEYFTGGLTGGYNLFKLYNDTASIALYGQRINRDSDNRVTVTATADAIGTSAIAANKDEQFQTEISISCLSMDISLLKPGKTVSVRGFNSFIDSLILQIVRVTRTPSEAKLLVGILPPRTNNTINQITRNLIALQTVDNPTSPS